MTTSNSGRVHRVDKFNVPSAARAEFLARVEFTHHLLRGLPGFIQDAVLEQTDGPGRFNFVTMVTWENRQAVEAASAVVTVARRKTGFDPQDMLSRLGIEADYGNYQELQS